MGGETGPDLTRSALVAEDVRGDKIIPLFRNGRVDKGMPPFSLPRRRSRRHRRVHPRSEDKADRSTADRRSRGRRRSADRQRGGRTAIFQRRRRCAKCHSPTGDLAGLATRLRGSAAAAHAVSGRPRPRRRGAARRRDGHAAVRRDRHRQARLSRRVHDCDHRCVRHYRSWPTASEIHGRRPARRLTSRSSGNIPTTTCTTCSRISRRSSRRCSPIRSFDAARFDRATALALGVVAAARCVRCAEPARARSRRAAEAAGRQLADVSRRLHRPAPQPADADHARQRRISSRSPGRSRPGGREQSRRSPILVNGVIYVTMPDNIWAIDARTGRQLWRYTYPTNQGFHIGHRGAAVYKDTSS